MPISRRIFIRVGTLAAIAAGICLRPGLASGQDPLVALPATDPLSHYTQAAFTQYINSIFTLLRGRTTVQVTLMKVEDTLPAKVSRTGGRESFALHFRGGGVALPQDTYTLEHSALGTFSLLLVPSGADENGAQGYIAVINRLPYSANPPGPAGTRKPLVRKPSTTPSGNTPAQTPTQTPPAKPRKGNSEL